SRARQRIVVRGITSHPLSTHAVRKTSKAFIGSLVKNTNSRALTGGRALKSERALCPLLAAAFRTHGNGSLLLWSARLHGVGDAYGRFLVFSAGVLPKNCIATTNTRLIAGLRIGKGGYWPMAVRQYVRMLA